MEEAKVFPSAGMKTAKADMVMLAMVMACTEESEESGHVRSTLKGGETACLS